MWEPRDWILQDGIKLLKVQIPHLDLLPTRHSEKWKPSWLRARERYSQFANSHVSETWPARGSWSHRLLTESQFGWNLSSSLYHVPSNLSTVIFWNVRCISPRTPVTPASRDSYRSVSCKSSSLNLHFSAGHLTTFSDHLHHFTEYDIFNFFSSHIYWRQGDRGVSGQVKAERGVNTREWNVWH